MRKVLVTGATGFIGNYVIHSLLSQKYEVIASSQNEDKARQNDWFDRVTYIQFDLKEFESSKDYYNYFNQPDLMIHLAWSGLPNYESEHHLHVNLPLQFSFLKNLIKNGLVDLTVTGTCLEYGMIEGELSEEMDVNPITSYGEAKNELRKSLENLILDYNVSLKWLRLFYMWGKGQSSKSLISQLELALEMNQTTFNMSGGEQVRDFLPVDEMSDIIVKAALQTNVEGIINCCSGKPTRLIDFIEQYLKINNKEIELNRGYYSYPKYEPMEFWGNTQKLNLIL